MNEWTESLVFFSHPWLEFIIAFSSTTLILALAQLYLLNNALKRCVLWTVNFNQNTSDGCFQIRDPLCRSYLPSRFTPFVVQHWECASHETTQEWLFGAFWQAAFCSEISSDDFFRPFFVALFPINLLTHEWLLFLSELPVENITMFTMGVFAAITGV